MRLIDADEIIKDRVENDPVRIAVQCAPIAFDKEKVMNEIKEYKEDAEKWANKSIENADEFSAYVDAYKNCLDIVEKGGIE